VGLIAFVALSVACDGDGGESTPSPTATQTAVSEDTPAPSEAPASPAASTTPEPAETPRPTNTPEPDGTRLPAGAQRASDAARNAMLSWLGPVGDPNALMLVDVVEMTWPDGCLGIARAGIACTEALVPGYLITFAIGKATYEVRSDLSGSNLVWVPQTMILVQFKEASPNIVEFMTDDGGTIVTQAVPGTDFGVDLQTLQPGEAVGIAIVDAPQAEHALLVWVDPVTP
jgi:hypothetical protein